MPTFAQADDTAVVWPVIDEDHRVLFVMSDSIPRVTGGCVVVGRPLWSGENAGNGQEENAEENAGQHLCCWRDDTHDRVTELN